MDRIFIDGLEVETLIGLYDFERTARQPLVFDIALDFDGRRAAASDDIADTLDYACIVDAVKAFVASREDVLIERLAEALCTHLADRFRPAGIELRVRKPQAAKMLGCAAVGVVLRRRFQGM